MKDVLAYIYMLAYEGCSSIYMCSHMKDIYICSHMKDVLAYMYVYARILRMC